MSKPTARIRTQAAHIAALRASNQDVCTADAAKESVRVLRRTRLAWDAYLEVPSSDRRGEALTMREQWGEAEAWLRTGWTPTEAA
jgi:hypothetical protein